jgi:hypothetical protein
LPSAAGQDYDRVRALARESGMGKKIVIVGADAIAMRLGIETRRR